jgi:predicted membrane metal-binding protein
MTRFHPEALLFCAAWAALAIAGGIWGSWWVAVLLSFGLLLLISAASLQILTQSEDMALERQVRWGILVVAALALLVGLNL